MKIENLKVFEFDGGEKDWIIARNKREAIQYYTNMVGEDEMGDYEISSLNNWHQSKVRYETDEKQSDGSYWGDVTMLDMAKERYANGYDEPEILVTTCV